MRPWAIRLLHALLSAPVLASVAIAPAPVAHAQEPAPPAPYVVAIDAGHGGTPDNGHPEVPFDPGAIGLGGLQEKDLTLDIAQRVRRLLAADLVQVVMTRDDDRFVSIDDRSRTAQDARASLFVSIHLNSWTDPSVGGSLVLYPGPRSTPFATVMSQALGQRLAPLGVQSKGIELRDTWWVQLPMPVTTVEGAYLTNPQEAAALTTAPFRQALAQAIRDGIEAYDPAIATRRTAITAWNSTHPGAAVRVDALHQGRTRPGRHIPTAILWLGLTGLLAAGTWYRRALTARAQRLWQAYEHGGLAGLVHSWAPPRRRRQMRRRELRRRPGPPGRPVSRPHSVYDELWF